LHSLSHTGPIANMTSPSKSFKDALLGIHHDAPHAATIHEEVIEYKPAEQIVTEHLPSLHEQVLQQPQLREAPPPIIREEIEVERKEKAPVVEEHIIEETLEVVQPVVNLFKEQVELKEVTQDVYEKVVKPLTVEEKDLAAKYLPLERAPGVEPPPFPERHDSTVVEPEHHQTLVKEPVMLETIHKKIIEEVQPVIHRETIVPTLIKETQQIYERILEPPVVTYEVKPAIYTEGYNKEIDPFTNVTTLPPSIEKDPFISATALPPSIEKK